MNCLSHFFKRFLSIKTGWMLFWFFIANGLSTGLGMGIPFFNILLGLPTGWVLAHRLRAKYTFGKQMIGKILQWSALTAALTLFFMLIIWSPSLSLLFDPTADLENFGTPMILYEPRASFIGWFVLMVLISPFLQMLMSLFSATLTLYWQFPENAKNL